MLTAIVFFKYRKELSDEEIKRARMEWKEITEKTPEGSKIPLIADHAFGTNYNGFFILQSENFERFLSTWEKIKDKIRWYATTRTIIGTERA